MKGYESDLWWMNLMGGIALLLFGLLAIVWPGLTFGSLILIFGIYILVAGVINILVSFGSIAHHQAWFLKMILGAVQICAGTYLLKNPQAGLALFVLVAGITFILQGIVAIIAAFVDSSSAGMKVLEVILGVLAIMVGIGVMRNPTVGGVAFVWVLGIYGLIGGCVAIAQALSMHREAKEISHEAGRRSGAR